MHRRIRVLHVLPHLGGGVGKALHALAKASHGPEVEHRFLLLEPPEKTQFVDMIASAGCAVEIRPDSKAARELVSKADVVELEWWNHPATSQFLCGHDLPPMRLLVWCHVSGLHTPIIPVGLIEVSEKFLFTSACSLAARNLRKLTKDVRRRLGVVSSGVGFSGRRRRPIGSGGRLRFGYVGSLNFAKLHPNLVGFLGAVKARDFRLVVWGDELNRRILASECELIGRPDLLEFAGYTTAPADAMRSLDVFVYLLNPTHYGTAENALLEAMSLGVVPIVLNNPAEAEIVGHRATGMIVSNPREFARAVEFLGRDREALARISESARKAIGGEYTPSKMAGRMLTHYREVMGQPKRSVGFRRVLGTTPAEWYMACQADADDGLRDFAKYVESERTKGSLEHFLRYFSGDAAGLSGLRRLLAERRGHA